MRLAIAGPSAGPLVVFLHGWPESWFSWRYQLECCAENGYLAVAPDMRGYGSTTAPVHYAEYNVYTIAADILAVVKAMGHRSCCLVGHDWGSWLTWQLGLLHPAVFTSIVTMSVPYAGKGKCGLITMLKRTFGDPNGPNARSEAKFMYMLHHNLPNAAEDYDENPREALYRIYCGGFAEEDKKRKPEITSNMLYVNGRSEALWKRIPRPTRLPDWLPADEFEYYVQEYARTGFEGGLNYYRVPDVNFAATPQLVDAKITQPVLFIAGEEDGVLSAFGGPKGSQKAIESWCCTLPSFIKMQDTGFNKKKHNQSTRTCYTS